MYFAAAASGGRGSVLLVRPLTATGNVPRSLGEVSIDVGSPISAVAWCPFDDHLVAVGCDNGSVTIYAIPDGYATEEDAARTEKLTSRVERMAVTPSVHTKKVVSLTWNTLVAGVLLSASADGTACVTAYSVGDARQNDAQAPRLLARAKLPEPVLRGTWTDNGRLACIGIRGGVVYLFDPVVACGDGGNLVDLATLGEDVVTVLRPHTNPRAAGVVDASRSGFLLSFGFSQTMELELVSFDLTTSGPPPEVARLSLGTGGSAAPQCVYDGDTGLLVVGGRGETVVNTFEILKEAPFIRQLSALTCAKPQYSINALPKRCVDGMDCEILRLLRVTNVTVEPIKFHVPRRDKATFHNELFPDTMDWTKSKLTVDAWLANGASNPDSAPVVPDLVAVTPSTFLCVGKQKKEEEKRTSTKVAAGRTAKVATKEEAAAAAVVEEATIVHTAVQAAQASEAEQKAKEERAAKQAAKAQRKAEIAEAERLEKEEGKYAVAKRERIENVTGHMHKVSGGEGTGVATHTGVSTLGAGEVHNAYTGKRGVYVDSPGEVPTDKRPTSGALSMETVKAPRHGSGS